MLLGWGQDIFQLSGDFLAQTGDLARAGRVVTQEAGGCPDHPEWQADGRQDMAVVDAGELEAAATQVKDQAAPLGPAVEYGPGPKIRLFSAAQDMNADTSVPVQGFKQAHLIGRVSDRGGGHRNHARLCITDIVQETPHRSERLANGRRLDHLGATAAQAGRHPLLRQDLKSVSWCDTGGQQTDGV